MKNKKYYYIILLKLSVGFILVSCQKKHQVKSSYSDLNAILTLSNYKVSQKVINDSIVDISGYNKQFTIHGQYNVRSRHKLGWWDINDKIKNEKYLTVEIFLEGNIERKNQILFYHQNRIDTIRSKMYTVDFKYINDKKLKAMYHFYTPKSDFITQNVNLVYSVMTNNEDTEPKEIALKIRNNSHYYCEIDLSKHANSKNIIVGGLFSEYSSNKNQTEMGINDIFIRDTVPYRKNAKY